MEIKEIKNNYHYEKLSSKHDLSRFSCGVKDLDEFLKLKALKEQEEHLSVTYLAIYQEEILGFITILNDNIPYNIVKNNVETKYKSYPSVKIGRLGVNIKFKGLHFGTMILDDISRDIKELSEEIGIKFIVVDSYCHARKFYLKNSFTSMNLHNPKKVKRVSLKNKNKTVTLFKDINKI